MENKTMTAEEVLSSFLNKGLVHMIAPGKYILTSKVQEVVEKMGASGPNLDIVVPKMEDLDNLFPKEIREAAPDNKINALYNYCNIPASISRNGRRYMVRSSDASTRRYIMRFMSLPNINPTVMINCVKDYYKLMEYPKSMKNFISDGDFLDLYNDYLNGKFLYANGKKDNKVWR